MPGRRSRSRSRRRSRRSRVRRKSRRRSRSARGRRKKKSPPSLFTTTNPFGPLKGQTRLVDYHGDVYIGEVKRGLPNGKGRYVRKSNPQYVPKKYDESYKGDIIEEGTFKDGHLHGEGKRSSKKSFLYAEQGDFKNGYLRKGFYTSKTGNMLEGTFVHGAHILVGRGKRTKFGVVYEGEFDPSVVNMLTGKGKITFPKNLPSNIPKLYSGAVLEGNFIANLLDGRGKLIHKNGVHEGEFSGGMLNGKGKKTFKNGIVEEGNFVNDVLHGMGKATLQNETQEGFFQGGNFVQGKILTDYGDLFEGKFNNNLKLHGFGRRISPNGKKEEGNFKNGQLHGEGTRTIGLFKEQGQFKNDELHGQGIRISETGQKWEGKWNNGNRSTPNRKIYDELMKCKRERAMLINKYKVQPLFNRGKSQIRPSELEDLVASYL